MSDSKPDLTTTEVRQGNSRKTNLRVLIISLVAIAIAFALAVWFFQSTYEDTDTTIGSGTTLDEVPPADGSPNVDLDDAPMPVPAEEPAPVPAEPAGVTTPPVASPPVSQ